MLLKMHLRILRNIGTKHKHIFGNHKKITHNFRCFNTTINNLDQEHSTTKNENENLALKELLEEAVIDEREDSSKLKKKIEKDLNEPSSSSVIVFPGQGTQFVGMGKRLIGFPNVKEMYDRASEILDYDLFKVSCEGPESKLAETKYQQPAIFVASLAAVEKLRHENPLLLESCEATSGFSVGEITALTFADAFSFEDALKLVKIRGEAMQIACELNRSGMIAVFYDHSSKIKFAISVAKEYCQKIGLEDFDCRVANFLYPHCKVVAGNEEALEFIEKNKEDFKLKKIKRINVSGAFHTDLMKPAAYVFKEALQECIISNPAIPVYSNVDGLPYKNVAQIRRQLPKQIYSPVRWEQTLHNLYERPLEARYPRTLECGPGTSLSSILKMVNLKAWKFCSNIGV